MEQLNDLNKALTTNVLGLVPVLIALAVAFFSLAIKTTKSGELLMAEGISPGLLFLALFCLVASGVVLSISLLLPRRPFLWSEPARRRQLVVESIASRYEFRRITLQVAIWFLCATSLLMAWLLVSRLT